MTGVRLRKNLTTLSFLAPAPGYVAIPVFNVLQGIVLGAIAWLIQRWTGVRR